MVQSYKQVINQPEASRAANVTHSQVLTLGVDNYTGPSANKTEVPTGALVKYIEIQFAPVNLVSVANNCHISIELLRSGQTVTNPRSVGGDPQRNQVHYQMLYNLAQNQNENRVVKFKVPPRFQRVREGDSWTFNRITTAVFTDTIQVIYKFYR